MTTVQTIYKIHITGDEYHIFVSTLRRLGIDHLNMSTVENIFSPYYVFNLMLTDEEYLTLKLAFELKHVQKIVIDSAIFRLPDKGVVINDSHSL